MSVTVSTGSITVSALGCSGIVTLAAPAGKRKGRYEKLRILHVGVGGSIAPWDRNELKAHPDVVFTGLCDVDSNALAEVSKEFPEAFTCKDFRDAFEKHADELRRSGVRGDEALRKIKQKIARERKFIL